MNSIPMIAGAAITASRLPEHLEWFASDNRPMELQDWSQPNAFERGHEAILAELRPLLAGYPGPISMHGPYHGILLGCQDRSMTRIFQDRWRWALEGAASIGASQMVIHSPFLFLGDAFSSHNPARQLEGDIQRIAEVLAPIIEQAAQCRCTLVIENVFDKCCAPLIALIDGINSEWVRSSLDTGHAFIHTILTDGPSTDCWVEYLGNRLVHLHIQDSDGRHDRHWAPGQGIIPWGPFFRALGKLEQAPRLILEVRDFIEGWEFLKSHGWVR
jgi:sugar phosphate isomerase/epimerase